MKTKKLTKEEVEHIAKLANIPFNEKEISQIGKQLSETLNYIGMLLEVKTEDVEPTSQVTGLQNVFRKDEVEDSLSSKEVLESAPRKQNGYIVVKAIFDK